MTGEIVTTGEKWVTHHYDDGTTRDTEHTRIEWPMTPDQVRNMLKKRGAPRVWDGYHAALHRTFHGRHETTTWTEHLLIHTKETT